MAGNKRKYRANWQIDSIDGKIVNAGDFVEVEDEQAKQLLAAGALTRHNSEPAAAPQQSGKPADGK